SLALEMGAHGFHLGIQVVEIVQHEGLGKHGQLGRSEIILPVMADDEMFEQSFQLRGEVRQFSELGLQHLQFDNHMAEELAARGIGKGAIVIQLLNLADVMQKRSRQQQIAVDLGIIAADQIAGTEQGNDVIEESADVGVVKSLGGGGIAVALSNLRIRHEQVDQRLQVGILQCGHKFGQRCPEFADVLGSLGQIIGEVDFRFFHAAELVNGELKTVLVLVDQPLNLEKVVLLEGQNEFVDVIPHLGFDLAAAIGENQRQVWFAIFFGLHLLGGHYETGGDDLVFLLRTIGDKKLFHEPPRNRLA